MHDMLEPCHTTVAKSSSTTHSTSTAERRSLRLMDPESEGEDEGGEGLREEEEEDDDESVDSEAGAADIRMSWLRSLVNGVVSVLGFIFVTLPLGTHFPRG